MENRAHNVSKKALKVNRVLAMLTAFAIGLGAFCVPMTAFASGGGGGTFFGGTINRSFTNEEYVQLSYVSTGNGYAYVDMTSGTVSVDSSYDIFRVWVRLSDTIPKGASVNMNFNFSYATGSISSISMWFGEQSGQSGGTAVDKSSLYSSSKGNGDNYFVNGPIVVLEDTNMICFQIVFSNRSSSDMYLNFNRINYSYEAVNTSGDAIVDNQQEQINQSKNIFEVIGDIWSGIVNLPNNIKSALTVLFDNVQNAVDDVYSGVVNLPNNIKSALTILFNNVQNAVDDVYSGVVNLPNNIKSALTILFTNLQTAVGNVASGVADGLSGFLNNIKVAVDNVASGVTDALSKFFEDIIGTDIVDGSFFEEFQKDAQQNVGDLNDALSSAPDILRPSVEELPNIDEFAPSDDNFIVVIMKRLFGLEIVQTMCLCALTFGAVGYIAFGKR